MRSTFLLACLALSAACAPAYRPAAPAPISATAEVMWAGGPEGESPVPSGREASSPAKTPVLGTAVMVPAPRMAAAFERLRTKDLLIPVAASGGVKLEDTFSSGRDGNRQHNAMDILAPRNTPIVAADGGVILRLSTNALGGITIYAADNDREFVYYYAHLERYHDGLTPGKSIQRGDTLGYVGTSGNAPKDVPHLHFQIMLWPSDGKWWNGEPVNPYPVLRSSSASGEGRRRFY